MKKVVIMIITFYQDYLSVFFRMLLGVQSVCRQAPSCSAYAIGVIGEKGVIKGSMLAIKRIILCNPYSKIHTYA